MFVERLIGIAFAAVLSISTFAAEVIVNVAPPRIRVEGRGRPPGRGHVWIPGYHRWDGHRHEWVSGRWELRPRPRARWEPHHWVRRGRGWVFVEGHWR